MKNDKVKEHVSFWDMYENVSKNKYKAILELHEKLTQENIKHEFIDHSKDIYPRGYQIIISKNGIEIISFVQNCMSYGVSNDLIEAWNYKDDPVTLTCDQALFFIKNIKPN